MRVTVMDDVQLATTICQRLAAADVGVWRESSPYLFGEVGIFYGPIDESVDSGIGVTPYEVVDPYPVGVFERRVQVRYRGARNERNGADRLASAGFAALQGLVRVAGFSLVRRLSMAQLGTDANSRQERADNYLIILDNPEALT